MDIPPPGMVRNSGPDFDQTLDQPVDGAFHFFTPDIELADHMQEVVGQNHHLQPGLVGLEPGLPASTNGQQLAAVPPPTPLPI